MHFILSEAQAKSKDLLQMGKDPSAMLGISV